MIDESIPVIGLLASIVGIISAISYKFYRDSKKDHTISGFDKGIIETKMTYFKDELGNIKQLIQNIQDDVEYGRINFDSTQKQIADIRERIARMEGPQ